MVLDALVEDAGVDEGVCVGTFRWKPLKKFPRLPPFDKNRKEMCLISATSWSEFLLQRGGSPLIDAALKDKSIVDCLSFPLTTVYAIERVRSLSECVISTVVVVGATYKAEVRIFEETSYWDEVGNLLGRPVKLYFVGPEAAKDQSGQRGGSAHIYIYRGTTVEFLLQHKDLLVGDKTMVVGFNPGFGSGSEDLLRSWAADLRFLTSTQLPCVFTCASDYSDLRGESLVLDKLVGCRFMLQPQRNPFHMALTTVAQEDSSLWSCGNSFLYGFKGLDGNHGKCSDMSVQKTQVLLRLLKAFSKDSNWTISDLKSVKVEAQVVHEKVRSAEVREREPPDLWALE